MNKKTIAKDFKKWLKEDHIKEYENYEILTDRVLIKLYFFNASKYEKKETKLYVDMTSDKSIKEKVGSELFPVGKVLAVGKKSDTDLKPGDLITVSDIMADSKLNPEWVDYRAGIKEKPSLKHEIAQPPKYIGYIRQWKDYVFLKDKINPNMDQEDAYTFLLPERYILTKYNINGQA